MTPEAVVFDIGNVLLEWNPERFFDARIGAEARRRMFAEVDLHGMNDQIDAGGPFRETVYAWAGRYPAWEAQIRCWHDNWLDLAGPRIEGSVALLRALRARGVPVFALTNYGIETFAMSLQPYEFLSEFDLAFVSGHLGMIKPDPAIYGAVEAGSGVAPGRLLFTDDRADNIAAAEARGWQVHHFTGWQGWARRLVGAGLLSDKEAGL